MRDTTAIVIAREALDDQKRRPHRRDARGGSWKRATIAACSRQVATTRSSTTPISDTGRPGLCRGHGRSRARGARRAVSVDDRPDQREYHHLRGGPMGRLFGTDGIRGEANRYPMNAGLAFSVGQAVTYLLKRPEPEPHHHRRQGHAHLGLCVRARSRPGSRR